MIQTTSLSNWYDMAISEEHLSNLIYLRYFNYLSSDNISLNQYRQTKHYNSSKRNTILPSYLRNPKRYSNDD